MTRTAALLVAGLVAGLALVAPAANAIMTPLARADGFDGSQVICPPLPWPLSVPCAILAAICDETRLCE